MWIDAPVIDVITYFTGTLVYFMNAAVQIGVIVGILGIVWSSVQLAFGTLEIQKALVGTITKFFMFMFILSFYPSICYTVRNVATELGANASGKTKELIESEFAQFLVQLEAIVASENAEESAELAAALVAKKTLVNEAEKMKWWEWADLTMSYNLLLADDRLENAENAIELRKNNPSGNMKTVIAIKKVLLPIDADGNVIKDASTAKDYILNLTLQDEDGNDTGYLSPNAMLRIALISAQILWEKEWTIVTDEWRENDEDGFLSGMTKQLSIAEFPFARVFDIILVFITMIAIVVCMIFSLLQYVMAIVEFTIVISVAVICIPCMLMDGLKDIANKVLPAILAQAVKLTMITLCMFYGVWAFLGMAINTIGEGGGFNLTSFAYVIFTIFLAFTLTQNAPKLALALLNGQPQLSMGELVAAMGTAAFIGGAGISAMKTGASAVGKAAPAAARATMTGVGNANAIAKAGMAAKNVAGQSGASKGQQAMSAMKAGLGETGYRVKQGLSSAFHGAAHHGMKGGSMGGGIGGGSAGDNRFGYNNSDVKNGKGDSMRYGNAKDENGRALTGKEFIKAQGDAAAARATANMKPVEQKTHAKYPDMKAQSSYIGTDYKAPLMLPPPPEAKMQPPNQTIHL